MATNRAVHTQARAYEEDMNLIIRIEGIDDIRELTPLQTERFQATLPQILEGDLIILGTGITASCFLQIPPPPAANIAPEPVSGKSDGG